MTTRYFIVTDNSLHSAFAQQPRTNLIADLVMGRLIPAPIWQKRNYRLKFLLRTALFYTPTRAMLDNLSMRPDFNQLLAAQVTLPGKVHRQYLTRGLNASQRAQAIISHYQFIDSLSGTQLAAAMTAAKETILLELQGKDEARFTLSASSAGKAEREGETTLWLRDGNQTLLASATFSVVRQQEQWQLVIGGLQGPRRNVPHEVIKLATRACHGLFPKRLLIEFIWALAARSHIQAIYGVSDNGHVFRALRYRLSKGRHFHASYDEFWQSIDGVADGAWRWRLPRQMERKSLDAIASKKRAEYRRRFQLLDDLIAQVAQLTPQP
ncbi:VirK/YbjX family protein [Raoultella ornithinolytica]|uniref:VirK/YbjX family protein n=1 Tax=Raoultella ornithinolytica TaxID=54291 RepID=UPI0015517604|nr:VirK/YbjX family protein [Raoultella ornithinolytica]MDI0344163.1 VirK/YbjX family protein [Raoultella ornithinolytica]MDI0398162.1 VirK/YbjX family protein [Raoultella ornithinolytica]MDI0423739.1 VirK/YbjX family protein [Raoultella ornithinolytica]MDI0441414.1 VirK/YbjX family protein [Raoultella ornithinolytica]MDI0449945.1 VirK/YbjX family protein [Raoultella ornithinolytica]